MVHLLTIRPVASECHVLYLNILSFTDSNVALNFVQSFAKL